MKNSLLTILLFTNSFFTNAQDLIAVQNGGTPSFYEDLNEAITSAVAGDTLYIPGRSYTVNTTINKRLHLVGVGHNPDYTLATNRTVLTGLINLGDDSDFGSITGIYFPISAAFSTNMRIIGDVNGYTISRCFMSSGFRIYDGVIQNFLVIQNILGKTGMGYSEPFGGNNVITNNIFVSNNNDFDKSVVKNNVFIFHNPNQSYEVIRPSNCLIENNILIRTTSLSNNRPNNIFRNNLNKGLNGANNAGNQGTGNFLDFLELESVFVNYTGTFDEQNTDFHLVNNSPYTNAGTDGTDLGIYGGAYPWKEGSIPFNPHIITKQIAPTTDENGDLQINIQVQAQED